MATDGSGNTVANSEQRYTPFGSPRLSASGLPSKRTFTGQLSFVDEIGTMDYGARQYMPLLGRFLSADSVVPGAGNPQALNRYAYTINNPLSYTDPTGHVPCGFLWLFDCPSPASTAAPQAITVNQAEPQSQSLFTKSD